MKLRSIETTPSPNSMKLNLDEQISAKALTLEAGTDLTQAPPVAQQLLSISGVRSVFLISDFITLTREGHADWPAILRQATRLLGLADNAEAKLVDAALPAPAVEAKANRPQPNQASQKPVEVAIQVFRGIPVQVRVTGEGEQARVSLPERFTNALQRAILATNADYVAERRWQPSDHRLGQPAEVAQMVADELALLIDPDELTRLEQAALIPPSQEPQTSPALQQADLLAELNHPAWERRLKAVQAIEVNEQTLPAVLKALQDPRAAIRRWAAAVLGSSGRSEAVEPLCRVVLGDSSASVRRTAGDALSDLSDSRAIGSLCQALTDISKLVRWRAARFLNELGDQSATEPLRRAIAQETEFDVRLEMEAALERIEQGGEAPIPMWMRIAQSKG